MDEEAAFREKWQRRIDACGPCCSCLVILVILAVVIFGVLLR